MVSKNPTEEDLEAVVESIPEKRVEAARLLIERYHNQSNYVNVINNVPELRLTAAESLLAMNLNYRNFGYYWLLEKVPELSEKTWEKFLSYKPGPDELAYVITHAPMERERAWEELLKTGPTNKHLAFVMADSPELRERAWNLFLSQFPANDDLSRVTAIVEGDLRENAGTILLSRDSISTPHLKVLLGIPRLRLEAGKRLLERELTAADLKEIAKHVPELRDTASVMLEMAKTAKDHVTEMWNMSR